MTGLQTSKKTCDFLSIAKSDSLSNAINTTTSEIRFACFSQIYGIDVAMTADDFSIAGIHIKPKNDEPDPRLEKALNIIFSTPVPTAGRSVFTWYGDFCEEFANTMRARFLSEHAKVASHPPDKPWNFHELISIPSSTLELLHRVRFTSSVENILNPASESQSPSPSEALSGINRLRTRNYLEALELSQLVRSEQPNLIRRRLNVMITVISGEKSTLDEIARGLLTSLAQSRIFFECLLRAYVISEDGVVMRCGEAEAPHLFMSSPDFLFLLVQTPITWAAQYGFMKALQSNGIAISAGPAGTGKTETQKDFANLIGRQANLIHCSDSLSVKGESWVRS